MLTASPPNISKCAPRSIFRVFAAAAYVILAWHFWVIRFQIPSQEDSTVAVNPNRYIYVVRVYMKETRVFDAIYVQNVCGLTGKFITRFSHIKIVVNHFVAHRQRGH